jgi:hypothetical protein
MTTKPHTHLSADTAHVLNEWADLGSNALQWLKNIKDGISTADEALADMQFDYDRVLALSRAEPQALSVTDEEWQRALDCAMSCLKPPLYVSRSAMDNAMQHAFGMLSLAVTRPQPRGPHD